MVRKQVGTMALALALVLLASGAVREWRADRADAQRAVPTDMAFVTGHTLRTGTRAEVLAFFDTGCDTCAALYAGFRREAVAAPRGVRFAVVPYPGSPSVRAQVRALAIECAAIEERDRIAMQLIYEEQELLHDLHAFAARIGQRNAADFVSCVEEERFRFLVRRNTRLAADERRAGVFALRGPEQIRLALRARLDALNARPLEATGRP
jgi:hypothetical protein